MFSILQSEWYKLRKSKIISIVFVAPAIGFLVGLTSNLTMFDGLAVNQWLQSLLLMNGTYALLFLPLITGVLASVVCRYEHQAGGWKHLLALPVTRSKVFVSKYVLLLALVFAIQLLYLGSIYGVGMINGYTDPFPSGLIWKSIFGGWVATLPLLALQLWVSLIFKNFAAPLTINVIGTLPALLIVNSESFSPYYPWVQPFFMMYIEGDTNDLFFIPWDQFIVVVGGSFVLFFFGGLLYFQRKMF
ncbi:MULTISPECIES: ABC transporter permease [Clostridia]|uniref:ABC transporter permease n=1 Tax=Clostridia TaxID=186801 RepID=UPI000EA27874|nr:ABC transporter permease [Clostridium sp. 1xD42-85]NBJ69202.1 hypothetical protein [Roseburia sp. 1XD42-34]RKI79174.1 hypothetical protein D7V87_06880 [Clostridium sp. 1xD42-85]